jgi:hypothetical protein
VPRERRVDGVGLAHERLEAGLDRRGRVGLALQRVGDPRDGVQPAGRARVAVAQLVELAALGGQCGAGGALAVALEREHRHERRGAGLARQPEQRRARHVARVPAPRRVVRLDRRRVGGEQALQGALARRAGERRHGAHEVLAGPRRPRQGAQRRVDVLHAHWRRPGQHRDRDREMLDHAGERPRRGRLRVGHRPGTRDRVGERHRLGRRAAHGHDTGHVGQGVAPRAGADAPRRREAVPALPRAQPLARDARQLRELGGGDGLTILVHLIHHAQSCRNRGDRACPPLPPSRLSARSRGLIDMG